MARALTAVGVHVTVATTDDDGPGRRLNVRKDELVTGGDGVGYIRFRKDTEFYKYSRSLGGWLRRHVGDFDVVHVHALFSHSSVAAARSAYREGVPYVVRPLGVLNHWGMRNRRRALKQLSMRWIESPILRRAAAIHFTSECEREEAIASEPAILNARSEIIPLPIEVAENASCSPALLLAKFPQARGRDVVLFLSRLSEKKGIELLLAAFNQLRQERANAILVIAGDGEPEYAASLRRLVHELGLADAVIWTGFLAGAAKAAAFGAASAFVLPSYSENFGIAAAEALAAGVPTVLTEGVAISGDVLKAGAGLVVPADAKSIAAAILQLLDDPEASAELGKRGRQLVKECYSHEAIGEALVNLYGSILHCAVPG